MAVYVLIHNGFAGGWVWNEVADHLRKGNHKVYTPTMPGLAEREHLATPEMDLDTHIDEVINTIKTNNLQDIILAGASWGSMVITGIADKIPERISRLVYIDSLIPSDGQSWFDLLPPQFADYLQKVVDKDGEGWRIPIYKPVPSRWSDHPFKTVTQPVVLKNPMARIIPRTFIHCTDKDKDYHFGMTQQIARHANEALKKGWSCHEVKSDHLAILTNPAAVAPILLDIATDMVNTRNKTGKNQ